MFITKDSYKNPKYNAYYEIDKKTTTELSTYYFNDRIGIGGNAAVYECVDNQGNVYAVKFLLNLGEKAKKRFEQEMRILCQLNHPHIIKYIDSGSIAGEEVGKGKAKSKVNIPFLIMEMADGNIVDYMRQNEAIGYKVYAPQMRGLADALNHLHEHAIHRDIKPENILVRGETWLLSDFGLCTAVDDSERIAVTRQDERIGPKYWLSPEATNKIYFGDTEIDASSDVYQLCSVFWFIITRYYPLGIIDEDDYALFDQEICKQLLLSLKYSKSKRPQSGMELYDNIRKATLEREM